MHDFFYAMARLGGHQNRKSDHRPGWLVLWRGWTQLQAMLDGYDAAKRMKCGKIKGGSLPSATRFTQNWQYTRRHRPSRFMLFLPAPGLYR